MKVILQVGDIPLGSIVTKATGSVEYVLKDKLKIHGQDPQEINAIAGTRFMVSRDYNNINAVPSTLEVAWIVSKDELYQYLKQERNYK